MAGCSVSAGVKIAQAQLDAILGAASRAYPNECCGLLEGIEEGGGWRVAAIHETPNVSETPRRSFLVDPEAQFDLMRALRGGAHRLIGCFHSHPDGSAAPSQSDRAQAYEADFIYLIAGGEPRAGFRLKAFRWDEASSEFEELPLTLI
jgi:proteasome lid subunit RPN8/RPN11